MAFPQTAAPTETSFSSSTTQHLVDMPATVNSGDLLLMMFGNLSTATQTTPSGWTVKHSQAISTFGRAGIFAKVADGTEGGATVDVVTSAGATAVAQVYRFTGWEGTLAGVEIGAAGTSNNVNPDSPSLTASWGLADNLWLSAFIAVDDDETVSSYPTSYSGGVDTVSGAGVNSGCELGSARRERAIATENPASFTLSSPDIWLAFTIVIQPGVAVASERGPGRGIGRGVARGI